MKHPDWKIHTVSSDGKTKLYSRITDKGLLGLKSVATMREHMADILYGATDFAYKIRFDPTFESGQVLYDLPLESNISYMKYKKVLVVSPRDLIVAGRTHRVSETEVWLIAKSYVLDSHPPYKGIVRAEFPTGGWRFKQKEPARDGQKPLLKVTFHSEADFKISMFLMKSMGPKSGHITDIFSRYAEKFPLD